MPHHKPQTPPHVLAAIAEEPETSRQSVSKHRAPSEEISRRAYARFAERGYTHGQDRADWLAAESELRSEAWEG